MDADPIASLVASLESDGKPPLAWVVQWSVTGNEPVQAAWDASHDPWAMVQLLMVCGRDWPLGRYSLVDGRGLRRRNPKGDGDAAPQQYVVLGEGTRTSFLQRNAEGAHEIRRRIPRPPTLDHLLDRRLRGWVRR
jgi:hypothetical protein